MKRKKPTKRDKRRAWKTARQARKDGELRALIREACQTGMVAAIEHCQNFWNVSDGYKRYIEQQIELQADALKEAVRSVIREELQAEKVGGKRKKVGRKIIFPTDPPGEAPARKQK